MIKRLEIRPLASLLPTSSSLTVVGEDADGNTSSLEAGEVPHEFQGRDHMQNTRTAPFHRDQAPSKGDDVELHYERPRPYSKQPADRPLQTRFGQVGRHGAW